MVDIGKVALLRKNGEKTSFSLEFLELLSKLKYVLSQKQKNLDLNYQKVVIKNNGDHYFLIV